MSRAAFGLVPWRRPASICSSASEEGNGGASLLRSRVAFVTEPGWSTTFLAISAASEELMTGPSEAIGSCDPGPGCQLAENR